MEDSVRPRIPCPAALGAIGVPAKRWLTRAELYAALERGRLALALKGATVKEAAEAAGLDVEHFSRVFKEAIGTGPSAYGARLRLDKAQGLLRTTERPVSLIALDCGYSDASAFSRAFKAHFGMTPSQFRKDSVPAQ